MANVLTAFKANRTKIWVGAVTLLLVFYLVVAFQRAVLLMTDPNPVAKAIGVAYLLLPVIGAWALVRELLFGARTERLAKILEAEGERASRIQPTSSRRKARSRRKNMPASSASVASIAIS